MVGAKRKKEFESIRYEKYKFSDNACKPTVYRCISNISNILSLLAINEANK